MRKLERASYVRISVFGIEDSLVSTVGFLSGIAAGGMTKSQIFLTGIVLLFVEAFSMAIGNTIAEESAEDYLKTKEPPFRRELPKGLVMFFAYFFSGFVPLGPYLLVDPSLSLTVSIGLTFLALFLLGFIGAKILDINIFRNTKRTILLGGMAIIVGVTAGLIFKI